MRSQRCRAQGNKLCIEVALQTRSSLVETGLQGPYLPCQPGAQAVDFVEYLAYRARLQRNQCVSQFGRDKPQQADGIAKVDI